MSLVGFIDDSAVAYFGATI